MRPRGVLPPPPARPVEGHIMVAEPGQRVVLSVLGKPAPQGSKTRGAHGGMVEGNPRLKPWRERVSNVARMLGNTWLPLDGPLEACLVFLFDPPKQWDGTTPPHTKATYDGDKLVRAVFDGLTQGHLWVDDARVTRLTAERMYVGQVGAPLAEEGVVVEVRRRSP